MLLCSAMCCVPQAFQGPIKMEKLEYLVEARTQYVRVIGAETLVEDLAAFVPPQRARDVAKKPQSGKGVGAGMCVEKKKMLGLGAGAPFLATATSREATTEEGIFALRNGGGATPKGRRCGSTAAA